MQIKGAIITGATGFIGSRLARLLAKEGIKVIALGRKNRSEINPLRLPNIPNLEYFQVPMENIENLVDTLKNQDVRDFVFYHFAWGGSLGLSDLSIHNQYANLIYSVNAFRVAEKLGCSKFIHVGTMEEAFVKPYLNLDFHTDSHFNRHTVYALAKKATRDILKAESIQAKTDLIIATNSHVMGPNDSRDSFLFMVLKKILNGEDVEMTSGKQTFDSISVNDCAMAYKIIGEKGKRNSEYWIGTGNPRSLREYVECMAKVYPPKNPIKFGVIAHGDVILPKEVFDVDLLEKEVGFRCTQSFESALEEMYRWQKYGEIKE